MNTLEAYYFGMWVSLDRREKACTNGLDIQITLYAKNILMKQICMRDES